MSNCHCSFTISKNIPIWCFPKFCHKKWGMDSRGKGCRALRGKCVNWNDLPPCKIISQGWLYNKHFFYWPDTKAKYLALGWPLWPAALYNGTHQLQRRHSSKFIMALNVGCIIFFFFRLLLWLWYNWHPLTDTLMDTKSSKMLSCNTKLLFSGLKLVETFYRWASWTFGHF